MWREDEARGSHHGVEGAGILMVVVVNPIYSQKCEVVLSKFGILKRPIDLNQLE